MCKNVKNFQKTKMPKIKKKTYLTVQTIINFGKQ